MRKGDTKKGTSVLVKIMVGVGTFVLANVAAGICIYKRNMKKANQNENQNNQVYSVFFTKGKVDVNKDANNAYIACLTGELDIIVPKPVQEKMNIEITSFLSRVRIHVPADVKVTFDGPLPSKNDLSVEEVSDMDLLPEIHFTVKSKVSKVEFVND